MKKEIAGQLRPCRLNFSLKWIWQLSYRRQCCNNITYHSGYIHGIFFTQELICNSENSAWTLNTSEMDCSFTVICWGRFSVVWEHSCLARLFLERSLPLWCYRNHPCLWLSEEMFFAFGMQLTELNGTNALTYKSSWGRRPNRLLKSHLSVTCMHFHILRTSHYMHCKEYFITGKGYVSRNGLDLVVLLLILPSCPFTALPASLPLVAKAYFCVTAKLLCL